MKNIIVCEPWCRGFEHAGFNAALLQTITLAFPKANILFLSEPGHGEMVRRRLQDVAPARISFDPFPVPSRSVPVVRQFLTEIVICRRVLALARRRGAGAVVFSSLRGGSLLAAKMLMFVFGMRVVAMGVLHGELSMILGRQQRRPWNRALGLKSALRWQAPRALRLMVLGESIKREVAQVLPSHRDIWRSMELVTLHVNDRPVNHRGLGQPMRFGFLGAASKGFGAFCQLAQSITQDCPNAQFEMVGFLGNAELPENAKQYVTGLSETPLTSEEYGTRVESLTYCVGLDNPAHHRLAGSGTFVDGLLHAKPLIALRNPYLAYYFEIMGDIGYLCDSLDEVTACIKRILVEPPTERYARQVDNIVKGRAIFSPEAAAPKLRQVLCESPAFAR